MLRLVRATTLLGEARRARHWCLPVHCDHARRCVKLRPETRALFGPVGSIVDRGPCGGVSCIAVAKAVEPGHSCVAVARTSTIVLPSTSIKVSIHHAGCAAPHAVVRRHLGATGACRQDATAPAATKPVRKPPVAVEQRGGDAGA
eukprot:scaffold24838_cov66-Phaeocystis_antarctica.AAC.1